MEIHLIILITFLNINLKKIINVNLPISDTSEIIQKLPKIIKENLYIVTLPTPKQEIIAAHISKK